MRSLIATILTYSILITEIPIISDYEMPWNKIVEVYDANILCMQEIIDKHNTFIDETYSKVIGETIPGKRIVEKIVDDDYVEYQITNFDDESYYKQVYLFSFDIDVFNHIKEHRIKDELINTKSVKINEIDRSVYYEYDFTRLGENGYNFFRSGIKNAYAARAKELDVEINEVNNLVDKSGREVFILGTLKEYVPPKPVLQEDDEGYVLCATTKDLFKTKKMLNNYIAITEYLGDEGNRLVFPEEIDGCRVSTICQLPSVPGITSVVIPGGITVLEDSFKNWSELNQIIIGDGVNKIGTHTIENTAITNIQLPDSVETIGSGFFSCSNLTEYKLPKGVYNTAGIFENTNISQYIIPGTVSVVGEDTFSNCSQLTVVAIEDGVKRIEGNAFRGCKNLQAIAIPKSVEYIDPKAFSDYTPLLVVQPESYAEGFAIRNKYTYANQ